MNVFVNLFQALLVFGLHTDLFPQSYSLEKATKILIGENVSWALSAFFNLFNNKKLFFCIFIKLITYFCTSPI